MNPFKKITSTLTGRFVAWFLFISLVPMIIVAFSSYGNAKKSIENDQIANLATSAEILEDLVTNYFESEIHYVQGVSVGKDLRDGLESPTPENIEV